MQIIFQRCLKKYTIRHVIKNFHKHKKNFATLFSNNSSTDNENNDKNQNPDVDYERILESKRENIICKKQRIFIQRITTCSFFLGSALMANEMYYMSHAIVIFSLLSHKIKLHFQYKTFKNVCGK